MGHRISIDEARMLDNYEQMMDEIYLLYHTYPTNLIHINLSDSERAEMGEYDAIGRGLAERLPVSTEMKQKKVVLHNDPYYFNGLPRKR